MALLPIIAAVALATAGPGFAAGEVPEPPVRITRGELIEWNVRPGSAGSLALQTASGEIEHCKVRPDTYLTRATLRVTPFGVSVGDAVELIADHRAPEGCRALTIYIREPRSTWRRELPRGFVTTSAAHSRGFLDNLIPRGNITLTGIVLKQDERRIWVHTRNRVQVTFVIRPDTAFRQSGFPVANDKLAEQTQVFVRAGRTYEGVLEAYQVIWGNILSPR